MSCASSLPAPQRRNRTTSWPTPSPSASLRPRTTSRAPNEQRRRESFFQRTVRRFYVLNKRRVDSGSTRGRLRGAAGLVTALHVFETRSAIPLNRLPPPLKRRGSSTGKGERPPSSSVAEALTRRAAGGSACERADLPRGACFSLGAGVRSFLFSSPWVFSDSPTEGVANETENTPLIPPRRDLKIQKGSVLATPSASSSQRPRSPPSSVEAPRTCPRAAGPCRRLKAAFLTSSLRSLLLDLNLFHLKHQPALCTDLGLCVGRKRFDRGATDRRVQRLHFSAYLGMVHIQLRRRP